MMVLVLHCIVTLQCDTFFPAMDDLAETLVVEVCILAVQKTVHLENHLVVTLEMPATQWFLHPPIFS